MEKDGVSPRRGITLVGVMLFLYGITAFVYEHGMRVLMSHLKIMLVLIQTIVCSMFVFANFLMDANEVKAVKQKQISNWLMVGSAVFFLLLSLEIGNIFEISVLGGTIGTSVFEISKDYICEAMIVFLYPMLLTHIVRAIGEEGITSQKAKTAYVQIAMLTFMEFALMMCLQGIWIIKMAIFNIIAFMVATTYSPFGKKMKTGDKTGLFIIYTLIWGLLVCVYSRNGFMKINEYFYEYNWEVHKEYIRFIMEHAKGFGTSTTLLGTPEIRAFLSEFPRLMVIWLLVYGGWFAVSIYMIALMVLLYILFRALCPISRKINVMYPVFLMAYFNILARAVMGLMQNFAILQIPVNLPFSNMFSLIMDTFCMVLLVGFGEMNYTFYWQDGYNEFIREIFEDDDEEQTELSDYEELDEETLNKIYEEEDASESSNLLKIVVGILISILLLGTWIGSLSWLEKNIPSLYNYEIEDFFEKREKAIEKLGDYADFVLSEGYVKDFGKDPIGFYYDIADIDNNGVPELLMNDGDYTMSATRIYTMDEGKVVFLGAYSQYGELEVLKGTNDCIICSEYGNMGVFRDVFTKMQDGKMDTIAAFASDGTGRYADEVLYYMGFPFPEGVRADSEESLGNEIFSDEYLVPEEEFEKAIEEIEDSENYVKVVFSCENKVEDLN